MSEDSFDTPVNTHVLIQALEASNLAHSISSMKDDMPLMYVNQAFLDMTGYSADEIIGTNCRFLQGPETDKDVVKRIRKGIQNLESFEVDFVNYRKDGTKFLNHLYLAPVYDGDDPIAYIGIQSDVTKQHQKLAMEHEREKLESLGRMTTTLSHEIKNALQPIKLMVQVLEEWETHKPEDIEKFVHILSENTEVALGLTNDVLKFSRKQKTDGETKDVAVITLFQEAEKFVKGFLPDEVLFSTSMDSDITDRMTVAIKQRNFKQVLTNLVGNALDAMNQNGALYLSFALEKISSEEGQMLELAQGQYLCIQLKDSGKGIKPEHLRTIFDPFFTTKEVGKGTGLGLSISYGIIKDLNGTIICDSEIGKGTTFTIYLPLKG